MKTYECVYVHEGMKVKKKIFIRGFYVEEKLKSNSGWRKPQQKENKEYKFMLNSL